MKIIGTDNYGRESVADVLVAENVSENYGKLIVRLLNEQDGPTAPVWYELVSDDYKLWRGMEELV